LACWKQVTKRERQIPIEIQQQAVDLDEKMFGVAAPVVGRAVRGSGSSMSWAG
jgi:hypothetical protein